MRRVAAFAALVLWAGVAHAWSGADPLAADNGRTRSRYVAQGMLCDGVTDAGPTLSSFASSGTTGTIQIPSGCYPAIGGPSASGTAITLSSNTTLRCDWNAGLTVAGKTCSSGRYAGAACAADSDCNYCGGGACTGATCVGLSPFAPSGGSTYTLIGSTGTRVAVEGCTIRVRQVDNFATWSGGSNAGKPCLNVCSLPADAAVPFELGGFRIPCAADATCTGAVGSGSVCIGDEDAGGGTCSGTPGAPSGMGDILPIDFSDATWARVEDVQVTDQRIGDFAVAVGIDGRIRNFDNTDFARRNVLGGTNPTFEVATQLKIGTRARARGNRVGVLPSAHGIHLAGDQASIADNAFFPIWPGGVAGTVGVYVECSGIAGCQNRVTDNMFTDLETAGRSSAGQFNITIMGNRMLSTGGSACAAWYGQGAGFQFVNNYANWHTTNCKRCGTTCSNAGAPCTVNGDCTSCTASAHQCLQEPILWLGGGELVGGLTGHAIVGQNIFAGTGDGIRFGHVGRRCINTCGADCGKRCTSDAQCNGGTGTCSTAPTASTTGATDGNVSDNTFFNQGKAIDLSDLVDTDTILARWKFTGNESGNGAPAQGIVFPTALGALVDAFVQGNDLRATTVLPNWQWPMGYAADNWPLAASEDAVTIVPLVNKDGAALMVGEPVEAYTSATSNAVKGAVADSLAPIGVALDTTGDGTTIKVAVAGTTTCITTDAAVARGDRLKISSTAKRFATASATEPAFAVALTPDTDQGAHRTVRCKLAMGALPRTTTSSAPVVYATTAAPGCSYGSSAAEYNVANIAATGLVGGKTATILLSVSDKDSGSGVETVTWKLYRATSSCPTACSQATPTGTALAPTGGYATDLPAASGIAQAFVFTDSATVASTTNYCLTATRASGSNAHTLNAYGVIVTEAP